MVSGTPPTPERQDRCKYWLENRLKTAASAGELANSGQGLSDGAHLLPVVRAECLRQLVTTEGAARAVLLRGARVVGDLNLHSAEVQCPLVLQGCAMAGAINLSQAETREINFTGCRLKNLAAEQAMINGNFWLDRSELTLLSIAAAHVKGQLSLNSVKLAGASYPPDLGGAELVPPEEEELPSQRRGDVALMGDQIEVDQGIYCRDGFEADGSVRFVASVISGPLDFSGATLGRGLNIDRARITGQLNLSGAEIRPLPAVPGAEQLAVNARQATVGQGVLATASEEGFLDIVGDVRLKAAELPGGVSLDAVSIVGELDLSSAHLSELDLGWCELLNPDANSLNAAFAHVDRFVFCDGEFTSDGTLSLVSARIDGSLELKGEFSNAESTAVDLRDVRISERLRLHPVAPLDGVLDLRHSRVGEYADAEAVWPKKISLHGFEYVDLHAEPHVGYEKRLKWVERDPDRGRDEYWALAAFYRRCGDRKATRNVLIAGERRRRDSANPLAFLGNLLSDCTIGFGYAPWRALFPLAVLLVFGSLYFSAHRDEFAKVDKPAQAVKFSSPLYTLDSLVPVLDFRQESTHRAREGGARTVHAALTILGWVITTSVVAGVTNVLVRRE